MQEGLRIWGVPPPHCPTCSLHPGEEAWRQSWDRSGFFWKTWHLACWGTAHGSCQGWGVGGSLANSSTHTRPQRLWEDVLREEGRDGEGALCSVSFPWKAWQVWVGPMAGWVGSPFSGGLWPSPLCG